MDTQSVFVWVSVIVLIGGAFLLSRIIDGQVAAIIFFAGVLVAGWLEHALFSRTYRRGSRLARFLPLSRR
jgi:hypothetical protein